MHYPKRTPKNQSRSEEREHNDPSFLTPSCSRLRSPIHRPPVPGTSNGFPVIGPPSSRRAPALAADGGVKTCSTAEGSEVLRSGAARRSAQPQRSGSPCGLPTKSLGSSGSSPPGLYCCGRQWAKRLRALLGQGRRAVAGGATRYTAPRPLASPSQGGRSLGQHSASVAPLSNSNRAPSMADA
ncbi:unnamed protein product, partial [Ixodes persulcatus]